MLCVVCRIFWIKSRFALQLRTEMSLLGDIQHQAANLGEFPRASRDSGDVL